MGETGFYRDDVSVSLAASDAQSGVASSEIAVDGAPLAPYSGPVVVSAAGPHQVAFRSTDVTGHRETTKTVSFTIDRTAPTLGPAGSVAASAAQFSPNGDGVADTIRVSHALTERGAVRLVVTPLGGGAARSGPSRSRCRPRVRARSAGTGATTPAGSCPTVITR